MNDEGEEEKVRTNYGRFFRCPLFLFFFFFHTTEIRGGFARYRERYLYIEDVLEKDDTRKSVDIFATGDYFTSLRL